MKKLVFINLLAFVAVAALAQPSLQEGIKMIENENYKGALDQFNAIAKGDPKNGTIYYYIGQVSYLQENPAEADKAYKKGLSINSSCAECKIGLGQLLLDQNKLDDAQEYFESAMRLDKKNPEIYAMVGEAYLMSMHKDANLAAKYLGMARDMNPKVARYWAHLGDAYEMQGDNGQAMTCYETAVGKDPNNTEAYISIAHIWAAAKQYDTAIVYLQKAITLSPNDAAAYKDLIELYIRTGQYEKVTPLLTKYTQLTGDDVDAKVRLVKFLTFQAKDYDRAIQLGEEVLKTNPEQYTLHRWLAWSYGEKQMYKESYDHSKMLFDETSKKEERKSYPSDYEYMAKAAMGMGNLEEASHIYRKYLELDSVPAYDIYGMLAKAFFDKKNYEQAIAYYKRRAEVKPLTLTDYYWMGLAYFYTNQNLESDSCFAQVLTITPNYAVGWLMRARIANRLDPDASEHLAYPFYKNYITYATEDIMNKGLSDAYRSGLNEAYYYMGAYHVHTDSLDLAKEDFRKAVEMDSTDDVSKSNYELLQERMKGGH